MRTRVQQLDGVIQRGRGVAANVLGQTYDAYRLGGTTNDAVISGTPAIAGFAARIFKAEKKAIENTTFALIVFEATCDNRKLELQDVFVETGYKNDGGVWTLAQMRPTRETLWVRTEGNCLITRPYPTAGNASNMPTSGNVFEGADGEYSGTEKAEEQVLTLSAGLYAFTSAGSTPASVQCGLQPLSRIQDGTSLGTPTDLYRERYLAYVPMLPGEQLNELDRINFPNSDRYEVAMIYTSDLTGFSGYIAVVEKLGT